MSDAKADYSSAAHDFKSVRVPNHQIDRRRYESSKKREERFGDRWKENPANLNDMCDAFVPGEVGHWDGVKWTFENERYQVKADMASGYLRIFDKVIGAWVKLDGTLGDNDSTHFKILRREEM